MSKSTIVKKTVMIMIMTFIGKVLGLYRETLIASKFGATYSSDIYFFANGIVSLLFSGIGTGIATTFIPMLTEVIEKNTKADRNRFVSNIINVIMLIIFIITIIGIIFCDYIVYFLAPGFRNNLEVYANAVKVTRIMFLCLIFITLQNVFTGVLQSHNEFTIPAVMGILLNLVFIIYLAIFSTKFGVVGLAIISVIAYFVQFVIHIPEYRNLGYRYKIVVDFKDERLKKIIALMGPVIIGTIVAQVNLLIDRILATTLGEGAISVLNFANKLNLFGYGIFAVAVSTVAYTSLSTYSAQQNNIEYKKYLIKAVNAILIVMMPATVGMMVLRKPLVNITFNRGAFSNNAMDLTAKALFYFSPAMVAYGVRDVFNRAFYSIKDTKTPMINSIIGVLINIILNILLSKYMGVAGLALATSTSAIVTTVLLMITLNKKLDKIGLEKISVTFIKITIASIIMGVVILIINNFLTLKLGFNFKENLVSLIINMLVGMLIYIMLLKEFKLEEYYYVMELIKKRKK